MTTTIVLADADDGHLQSVDVNYSNALNGPADGLDASSNFLVYGQEYRIGQYELEQFFCRFAYTHPSNEVVTSAVVTVQHTAHSTPVTRSLVLYQTTYGPGTPTNSDWVTPPEFDGLTRFVRYPEAQASGITQRLWAGSDELTEYLATTGTTTVSLVGASDRQLEYGSGPTAAEYDAIASSQVADKPYMVVSSVPRSTLHGVLGGQVRLSDGTWVVLESNALSSPTITLRHVNGVGTASTKATLPIGTSSTDFAFGIAAGAQQLALLVDDSDNLYVIGRRGDGENTLAVKAYVKGVGYSWTAASMVSAAMGSSDSKLNNFAGAWHDVGAEGDGTLVVFAARANGDCYRVVTSEVVYATLNATVALAGTGTLVRSSGNAVGTVLPVLPSTPWTVTSNETGTGLDVAAIQPMVGVMQSWGRREGLGVNQPTYKCRYTLTWHGNMYTLFGSTISDTASWAKKTAAGKLRVLPVDTDLAVFLGSDSDDTWGIFAWAARNNGTATSWTALGRVDFDNESIATMPSPATLGESQAWDAAYVSSTNKVWLYYFDQANGRRLMRTAMSLSSYTATREETELSSTVGASGSTNLAIRTSRDTSTTNSTLVSVANRTAGGTHSTIYVVDDPNVAPSAPTLGPRSNFDASASATFTWTFSDPNPTDTQSGFQVDINSASGVDYYDSGRQTGTISYVGAGTASAANNASLTPTLPASAAPGDLLLLLASIRNYGTGTPNTPSKWKLFAQSTTGNMRLFGRIFLSGAASADNTPTVTFASGAANATTLAQMSALRGTDQNLDTVISASAGSNFVSAQDLPYMPLDVPASTHWGIRAGWKQDDWTSVASTAGFTVVGSTTSTLGDDASMIWDRTTGTFGWIGGNWSVTGGGSAISSRLSVAIRPQPAPTAGTFTLGASTLSQPAEWQWRMKTWDAAGLEGAWSNYATFRTGSGATVTVTDPATDNPADFIYSSYGVDWSVAGATQADLLVEVYRTDNEEVVYTSGWVTSATPTHTVTGFVSDVEQRIEVTVRTSGMIESNTGTRLITPSFAAPETPIISVAEMPDDGHTLLSVTHPAPTGDHPDAVHALILRRAITGPDTGEAWVTIGAVLPGSTWADYTAAGGITYEYAALAVAADDSTSQSDPVEGTLTLQGLWIHDPADPANAADTARHYTYGPPKGLTVDPMGSSSYFVGRTDPVVEWGEHRDEQLGGAIQIPYSDTWQQERTDLRGFAEQRTNVCVRDGRGRRVFGALEGYGEGDERWGTTVSFRVRRSDYDETFTGTPT